MGLNASPEIATRRALQRGLLQRLRVVLGPLIDVAEPVLWLALVAVLAGYLAIYLSFASALLAYPFDLDQGESFDAYSGVRLARGEPIYTDNLSFPYYSSNYPPVYSLAVAAALDWWPEPLAAARLVSIAAALGSALLIMLAVRKHGGGSIAGLVGGLLFLASSYTYHTTPLARVNALALFFALAALLAFSPGKRWTTVLGVLFALLALYTKPTTVDAVLAGVLSLFLRDRRQGLAAGLAIGALGGAIFLALDRASGGAFYLNVVAGNVNPWSVDQLREYWNNFFQVHSIVLVLGVLLAGGYLLSGPPSPFVLYLGTSLAMTLTAGKWGAGESYFLGTIAAAATLAAVALGRWTSEGVGIVRLLLPAMLLVQTALFAHGPFASLVPGLVDRGFQAWALGRAPAEVDRLAGEQLVQYAQRWPGPVLFEEAGFALAAGQEVLGNATHLRNLYEAGLWQPDSLVRDVAAHRFEYVVLNAQLYPAPVLQAIGEHYFLLDVVEVNGQQYRVYAPGAR